MNINQLTSFVQAAELGSLSKAAANLYTVQSAVSRQVKALEEELETRLFVRHGRGLELTQTGQQLLNRATHILKEIEEAKSEIISSNDKIRGHVTIGLPPSVASVLVGPLAERLGREYPHIKLRFVDAFSETLSDWLQRREVDFVVLYDNQEILSLRTYPLLEENLYLIMHPKNPLSELKRISFKEVISEKLILPSQKHSLRKLLDRTAKNENIKLNVTVDADSLILIKELVRTNLASTILSLSSVNNELKEGSVKVVPIIQPSISRKLLLAMPTDRPSSNASLKVSEILRQEVKKLVENRTWKASLLMPNN